MSTDTNALAAELAAWLKLEPATQHRLMRALPDALRRIGLELAPAGTAERYARCLEREHAAAVHLGAYTHCPWCRREVMLAVDGSCARCGQHVT